MRQEEQVDLIIRAITEGFEKVRKDVTSVQDKVAKSTSKVTKEQERQAGGLIKLKSNLVSAAAAYHLVSSAGQTVMNMFRQAGDILDTAQAYERTQVALIGYTGSAENAARAMMMMEDATGGALDKMSMAQMATKLFSMNLADTAEEASILAEMAVTLGAAMGKGPQQAFEDFTLLLANQSILRLDNFGISSGRVRERIDELRESTDGMTRETAFMIATLEIGRERMEQLADAGFETTSSWDQFKATWADITLGMKAWIASAAGPAIFALNDLTSGFEDHREQVLLSADGWFEYWREMMKAYPILTILFDTIKFTNFETAQSEAKKAAAIRESIDAIEETEDPIQKYIESLMGAAEAEEEVGEEAEKIEEKVRTVADSFSEYIKAVEDASSTTLEDPFAGLDLNLASSIKKAFEALDFEKVGGREATKIFNAIKIALAAGRITPQQAEEYFEALYVEAQGIEVELGNLSFYEAKRNLVEEFGIGWREAEQMLLDYQEGIDQISFDEVIEAAKPMEQRLREARDIAEEIGLILDTDVAGIYDVEIRVSVTGDPIPDEVTSGGGGGGGGGGRPDKPTAQMFQHGGYGIVPPGYPNDTFPIFLTSGEDFIVRTPAQRMAAGNNGGSMEGIYYAKMQSMFSKFATEIRQSLELALSRMA